MKSGSRLPCVTSTAHEPGEVGAEALRKRGGDRRFGEVVFHAPAVEAEGEARARRLVEDDLHALGGVGGKLGLERGGELCADCDVGLDGTKVLHGGKGEARRFGGVGERGGDILREQFVEQLPEARLHVEHGVAGGL